MGDFTDFLRNAKLRKLGDPGFEREGIPGTMPEVGPYETLPEMEDDYLSDGPAMEAYQSHLRNSPDPADYQAGAGKGILASLVGALAGFGQNSAVAGASLGRNVLDAPYQDAVQNYSRTAKNLGTMADLESENKNKRQLFRERGLDRAERGREHDARMAEAEAKRKEPKPPRQLKPEVEYDDKGYATGRVFDPDTLEMKEVPGLKGFRRSAESPTMTQKKGNVQQTLDRARELQATFDKVSKASNTAILGNPHVGPGQGFISEMLTSSGMIDNPDVRNMHALAQELANTELYALSGAQINNKEYERLRRTLPDTNKSEAQFKTDIERFIKFHEAAQAGLISENDSNWTPPENKPTEFPAGTPSAAPKRRYTVEEVK